MRLRLINNSFVEIILKRCHVVTNITHASHASQTIHAIHAIQTIQTIQTTIQQTE